MPEKLRTTMEYMPGSDPRFVQIGHGQYSEIILDLGKTPPICLKIPYTWNDDQAQNMEYGYRYMKDRGFPVLPDFKASWGAEWFEMTDLTGGLRNLVASIPDISRLIEPERSQWTGQWNRVKPANGPQFVSQLGTVAALCFEHGVRINDVGLFLVATPEGMLQTYIADYDDGILHHRLQKPWDRGEKEEQAKRIGNYYARVAHRFFPQLPSPGQVLAALPRG